MRDQAAPITELERAWAAAAGADAANNVYAEVQRAEVQGSRRKLQFPCLIHTSQGAPPPVREQSAAGNLGDEYELYLVDVIDLTSARARSLAEAFRKELGDPAILWEYQPSDFGLELVTERDGTFRRVALVQFRA